MLDKAPGSRPGAFNPKRGQGPYWGAFPLLLSTFFFLTRVFSSFHHSIVLVKSMNFMKFMEFTSWGYGEKREMMK